MNPFAVALTPIFSGPGSVAVLYAGKPLPIRGIWERPTGDMQLGQARVPVDTNLLQIQRSDVARPADGDELQIGDERFIVAGEPRLDTEGLTWSCEILPDLTV